MTEKEKSENIRKQKLITLLLLEAGMRHRESYWRDNVDRYANMIDKAYEDELPKIKKKDMAKQKEHAFTLKKLFLEKNEKFNKVVYEEIEKLTSNVAPEAVLQFEEMTNTFSECTEELLGAKSKKDMVYVMKMYNAGFFDETLVAFKSGELQRKAKSGIISLKDLPS